MKLKIFIAQKMSNLSKTNVMMERKIVEDDLRKLYPTVEFEIIDNYSHPEAPKDAGRLWHLGKSIQQLEEADYIVFANNCWLYAKGCFIEKIVSKVYGIPTINIKKEKRKKLK